MMTMKTLGRRRAASGIALVIALIALVAVTLAALALVRSVSTGLEIAGNMAFKEASVAAGDLGTETAIKWLKTNPTLVNADHADGGYYASAGINTGLPTAVACDLTGNRTTVTADDMAWGTTANTQCGEVAVEVTSTNAYAQTVVPAGYRVWYVINRMCNKPGDPATDNTVVCNLTPNGAGGLSQSTHSGATGYPGMPLSGGVTPYYRITSRIQGPRNTVSYTQALVYLE